MPAVCCLIAQLLQRQFISACDHQSDRGVPAARLLPSVLAHFRQLRLHVHGGANGATANSLSPAGPGAVAGQSIAAAVAAQVADGAAAQSDDRDHAAQSDSNSAAGSADDGSDGDGDGDAQRMNINPS